MSVKTITASMVPPALMASTFIPATVYLVTRANTVKQISTIVKTIIANLAPPALMASTLTLVSVSPGSMDHTAS